MKLPLRIAAVLLMGLLILPGAAFGLAPKKKEHQKPKKHPPRQEQGEQRRSGQGDLGRFTENLPPQLRDAIHRLWDRMPPQIRDRVQERMGRMGPEQRQELVQRFSNRMQQRGGDRGRRGPGAGPDRGPGRNPEARRGGPQDGPGGPGRLAQAMRERFQQLSPEQRELAQKAMEGMSPERRKQIMDRVRGMRGERGPEGPNRPGPEARKGKEGGERGPGHHPPATAAGRPGEGPVAEERVMNVVRGEISKLPPDVRQRIREALGHLPPERRGEVLARALSDEGGGRRPDEARRPHRGDRPDAGPGRPGRDRHPDRRDERGPGARDPNRHPDAPRGDANRPPRRGNVERMIRAGIARLPEPVRKQIEDRLDRVLPRLSEGRGRGSVLQSFREALQKRFQTLSPVDQSKVMNWYRGESSERSI